MTAPLWTPSPRQVARSHLAAFVRFARAHGGYGGPEPGATLDYDALHAWSIAKPERFWPAVWRFCGVLATERPGGAPWDDVVIGLDRLAPPDPVRGPRWFPGARLNFAENVLRYRDAHIAIISRHEGGRGRVLTYEDLHDEVTRVAAALRAHGVRPGDRVAGFLPNIPEAVIGALAAARIGALWSSCSPDFGVKGVVDRFGQIAPRVLFCADGYRYAGKTIDSLPRVRDVVDQIPSIERVVVVAWLRDAPDLHGIRGAEPYDAFAGAGPSGPATSDDAASPRLPFDHPVYIMYSSGTTGLPKCMVHGAGGTLLQHQKEHVLHTDLGRSDRLFFATTCGWMMWNWLVTALATGCTIVLYDGSPLAPRAASLWDMAADERLTVFGASAKYLALIEKEGVVPARTHDLSALRAVLSTGSPLAPPSYDYVYEHIKRDVCLSSISGGTDIISCFALGNPAGPVWCGELQVPGLGMAVDVFDAEGRPTRGPGELVCTRPFPSMPVSFWNDPDGARYRAAYFEPWPGVWRHGDWAERTPHGGLIITGRSDATLNPGGVRIGTAEIYRQVEQIAEVVESLVVGQEVGEGSDRDTRIVLFVRLREGKQLDDALRDRIRRTIRENTSPHHVPKVIAQVADIPRTISGKITELAVRDVIHGRVVQNTDALANPEALELFRELPELRAP